LSDLNDDMITLRRAQEHAHAYRGWLDSWHTFSLQPGEFQYLAAGTGVRHSEFNALEQGPMHFLQAWIAPDGKGAQPRYAERALANAATNEPHLVASKGGSDGSIAINQDAEALLGKFAAGGQVSHLLKPCRHA